MTIPRKNSTLTLSNKKVQEIDVSARSEKLNLFGRDNDDHVPLFGNSKQKVERDEEQADFGEDLKHVMARSLSENSPLSHK